MIELRHCRVEPLAFSCRTHFPDGTFADASPHDTHHYFAISHRLGYQDNVVAYCREHEVCHALWAEWVHDAPSKVLWAIAHGKPLSGKQAVEEEVCAQLLQRWVRANERPIVSGIDWDGLKQRARELLDAH